MSEASNKHKIGIVGTRCFNDYELLKKVVLIYIQENQIDNPMIISGGAIGADKLAEQFANENNFEIIVFKPDWKKYRKSAGLKRNCKIVESSNVVIAFWDGISKGTKNTMDICAKMNKKYIIQVFPKLV
ncbi:MAG: DUF2493 domain-containing protein [Candidatus Kapabacteria bacterium]|nr:DUF2493 domain-containing protein [Candidatus Kapabacteria bacterium]